MLLFLVSWMLLAACAAMVGSAVLTAVKFPAFRHFGDRIITAEWLGLLAFAITLLGLSMIAPLRPGISLALVAVLTGLAGCSKSARNLLKIPPGCRVNSAIAGIGFLAVIVALDSTRLVQVFDTGLYHYQLVRWLSEYGTVPGLALLHFRFGFTSTWFALAAPFDFGPLQGRISGLLGGLAIYLALLHFALAVFRIIQRRAERTDWFLAGGYPLIFVVCFTWAFEVSLSPDVPVWILTLIVGWLMLLAGDSEAAGDSSRKQDHGWILPLILAFGTVSMKLSAAPAVAIAALFFWFNSDRKWNSRIVFSALASLLAVPFLAANVTSSGCPLYPSSFLCAALPWNAGKAAAKIIATDTMNWARWGGDVPPGATAWSWIPTWFSQVDKLLLLSFCVACLVGFCAVRGWRIGKPFLWVLALSLGGTAFLFITAPNPRFGAGYLAIFPALFAATAGPDLDRWLRLHFLGWNKLTKSISIFPVFIAVGLLLALQAGLNDLKIMRKVQEFGNSQTPAESPVWHRLLVAPAVPKTTGDLMVVKNRTLDRIQNVQLAFEHSHGIEYWRSLGTEQCWGVSLPCLPNALDGDVRLRRPENGFRSGFMRSTFPADETRIR